MVSFTMEEVIGLLLVAVVFVILILSASGWLKTLGIFGDFFDKLNIYNQKHVTGDDYQKASDSTRDLQCAINSVAIGEKWNPETCRYAPDDITTGMAVVSPLDKEKTTENTLSSEETILMCDESENYKCCEYEKTILKITSYKWLTEKECESKEGEIQDDIVCISDIGPKPSITCIIKNFRLPEKFGLFDKPVEYIGGVGDPSFILYFQNFPVGESADWEGQSTWYTGFGKIMFASFCVAHFVKPFVKAGIWMVKTAVKAGTGISQVKATNKVLSSLKNTVSKLGKNAAPGAVSTIDDAVIITQKAGLKTKIKNILNKLVTNAYNDDAAKYLDATTAQGLERNMLEKQFIDVSKNNIMVEKNLLSSLPKKDVVKVLGTIIKDEAFDIIKKTATNPKFWVYFGVDTAGSYVLARLDSEACKYEYKDEGRFDHSNSLVLKTFTKESLKTCGEDFELDINSRKINKHPDADITEQNALTLIKPIILDKPEFLHGITSLYLVSPCYADLYIDNAEVTCRYYHSNIKDNLAVCDTPQDNNWWSKLKQNLGDKKVTCGSLYTTIVQEGLDVPFIEKEMEIVSNMKTKIFKGTVNLEGIGEREEIFDPIEEITFYYNKNDQKIDYFKVTDKVIELGDQAYECSIRFNENDYELAEEISDDDKFFACNLVYLLNEESPVRRFGGLIKLPAGITTHVWFYGSLTEDEKLDRFFAIRIAKETTDGRINTDMVLKDFNADGRVDELGHFFYKFIVPEDSGNIDFRTIFSDIDNDGTVDEVVSDNCKIEAIRVTPERHKKPDEGDYNYCYMKEYEDKLGLVTMTASFGVSALAKSLRLGGLAAWAVSAATDCLLAWAHFKYTNEPWPGK